MDITVKTTAQAQALREIWQIAGNLQRATVSLTRQINEVQANLATGLNLPHLPSQQFEEVTALHAQVPLAARLALAVGLTSVEISAAQVAGAGDDWINIQVEATED